MSRSRTIPNVRQPWASHHGADAVRLADLLDRREEGGLERLLRADRPVTRGDCAGGERPCPWVSCRNHLYLEVTPAGSMKLNFPDIEPWEMPETCALDVADRGPRSLALVGRLTNLTRERTRQIAESAVATVNSAVIDGEEDR
jgi:hypothetical protein